MTEKELDAIHTEIDVFLEGLKDELYKIAGKSCNKILERIDDIQPTPAEPPKAEKEKSMDDLKGPEETEDEFEDLLDDDEDIFDVYDEDDEEHEETAK
jgi:hypothetical protein